MVRVGRKLRQVKQHVQMCTNMPAGFSLCLPFPGSVVASLGDLLEGCKADISLSSELP